MTAPQSRRPRSGGATIRALARAVMRVALLIGIGVLAGAVAGFVAGGIGSRLAMRAVALLAGPAHAGELTDAEAIVGQITLEGTLFLLFAATLLGAFAGPPYIAVRGWLPGRGAANGLAYGVFLLAVGGSIVVNPGNEDFRRFVPSAASVGLFAALFPLYGAIIGALIARLDRRGVQLRRGRTAWSGYALLAGLTTIGLVRDALALAAIF